MPTNIILGRKTFPETKTHAYFAPEFVTIKMVFRALAGTTTLAYFVRQLPTMKIP